MVSYTWGHCANFEKPWKTYRTLWTLGVSAVTTLYHHQSYFIQFFCFDKGAMVALVPPARCVVPF